MADHNLSTLLSQFIYLRVAPSTHRTYNAGVNFYFQFSSKFNITPYPASSHTLQFFCAYLAQRVSYKSNKVYLAGIWLIHLELDPTTDECLHLVVKGIRRFQGDSSRPRLLITINLLHTLKQQLRISNFSLVKQCLLRAAFMMAFYAFLCVSESTSTNNSVIL